MHKKKLVMTFKTKKNMPSFKFIIGNGLLLALDQSFIYVPGTCPLSYEKKINTSDEKKIIFFVSETITVLNQQISRKRAHIKNYQQLKLK